MNGSGNHLKIDFKLALSRNSEDWPDLPLPPTVNGHVTAEYADLALLLKSILAGIRQMCYSQKLQHRGSIHFRYLEQCRSRAQLLLSPTRTSHFLNAAKRLESGDIGRTELSIIACMISTTRQLYSDFVARAHAAIAAHGGVLSQSYFASFTLGVVTFLSHFVSLFDRVTQAVTNAASSRKGVIDVTLQPLKPEGDCLFLALISRSWIALNTAWAVGIPVIGMPQLRAIPANSIDLCRLSNDEEQSEPVPVPLAPRLPNDAAAPLAAEPKRHSRHKVKVRSKPVGLAGLR